MKFNLSIIALVLLLCTSSQNTSAQKDSLLVVYNYVYNTDSTGKVINNSRFCPLQKTYNSEGKLIREMSFHKEPETSKVLTDAFCFYFYKDNLLHTTECYSPDGIIKKITIYKYNREEKVIRKDDYRIGSSEVSKLSGTKYKYKDYTQITEKNYQNGLKDVITILNSKDSIVHNKVFSKKSTHDTISVKNLKYFEDKQLVRSLKIISFKDNSIDTIDFAYTYNDKNHLQEAVVKKNGIVIEKNYYATYPDGSIKNVSVFNTTFKKIRFIAFDKKLMYRDPDIKPSVASTYFKKL